MAYNARRLSDVAPERIRRIRVGAMSDNRCCAMSVAKRRALRDSGHRRALCKNRSEAEDFAQRFCVSEVLRSETEQNLGGTNEKLLIILP